MTEGTPKAIEPKGIVRNATKIGVQDGQAEDLINLRFMDGSWRASGNGRLIENMPTGTIYQQLYLHTNIYHHLLGVAPDPNNGDAPTLWWFAEIDNDGVTFYPLDGTSDRSQWPEDKQDLPTEPVAITTVTCSMWITQTGHLLTIIDEADDFEHFVFKTSTKEYIEVNMDVNGKATDRSLYPFGQVHFNWYAPKPDLLFERRTIDIHSGVDSRYFNSEEDFKTSNHKYFALKEYPSGTTIDTARDLLTTAYGELRDYNKFTGPRLACIAVRLYDGSYAYATNPVLIFPRERSLDKKLYYVRSNNVYSTSKMSDAPNYSQQVSRYPIRNWTAETDGVFRNLRYYWVDDSDLPDSYHVHARVGIQQAAISNSNTLGIDNIESPEDILPPALYISQLFGDNQNCFAVFGYDIVLSVEDVNFLRENKDVFTSLCVFVSPEIQDTEYNNKEYSFLTELLSPREKEDIVHDLLYNPLFLLKEYKVEELNLFQDKLIIDLSKKEDEGLLATLVNKDPLPVEATMRQTYLPKVSYMYNGRLHIANYKLYPFFGYPIDLFHLHNHSVKVQADSWFKGVLPNLTGNNDDYLQYPKTDYAFDSNPPTGLEYFDYITVKIDSSQGEQKVVRYIPPYDFTTAVNGRADFIESLNPLLTYPDARAKEMTIMLWRYKSGSNQLVVRSKTVTLKPHPYLNMAYYIDPDLKPITMGAEFSMGRLTVPAMVNTEEYFPNGLKVSKTDQPIFFPVENTYQVGSAEILALMSNTIAVGTGQTGDAPLYVFCKDGVYALYVDSSGQMAYPNARILARDVCNNPRSVTPIDAGVVFTTDRGLMLIAGEQVQEIGAPAEGDVVQFWNAGSVDYSKIATASMQQIAGLPSELCSTTDFLTYLQDKGTSGKAAIINYNHNMRELMVSNPNYPYSYVLDREGNWSRRDYTAAQYVNNYPTSYRVDADGHFYKVDDEGDANTTLEHRKESDNKIFYLSNVIKLDSIGFKQAYRFVVRGYFETQEIGQRYLADFATTPNDYFQGRGSILLTSNEALLGLEIGDCVYIRIGDVEQTVYVTDKDSNPSRITFSENLISFSRPGQMCWFYKQTTPAIACVVEGSYDGRKFKPLGYNRKSGKFRDIGCIVERTDVRFFRICLSGQVTGKTRIDYMEMSAGASMLNTKIR